MSEDKKKSFIKAYRTTCRKAHGDFPGFFHVHHIDANRMNNEPDNLIAVHPKIHVWVHKQKVLPTRSQIEEKTRFQFELMGEYLRLKARIREIAKERREVMRQIRTLSRWSILIKE